MNDESVQGGNAKSASGTEASAPPRLNLFAFPSLTTLLFTLIAGVILLAVGAGLRQNASALGVMVVLGMVVLPLRSFLRQVDYDLSHLASGAHIDETSSPDLAAEVDEAAKALGLHRPPYLLIVPVPLMPRTIGSWRRRHIAIGRPEVQCLSELPDRDRRVLWLHEVAHFANGDHWKVGLARSLLSTTIGFMTWCALFLLGIVIMSLVYGFELFEPGFLDTLSVEPAVRDLLASLWPDAAAIAPLLEKAKAIRPGLASLYVLNAFLPFVFSGILLLPFVWRRLVQVREFYADARVAAQVGDAVEARNALSCVAQALALSVNEPGPSFLDLTTSLRRWLSPALAFHPSWPARRACLQNPLQVFGTWQWAGLIAGLTVLLLDLVLVGPFTLGALSGGPAHFTAVSGFVILGVWLVPGVCQGFPSTGVMVRRVAGATLVLVAVRAAWLALNTALVLALLVLDPGLLKTVLNDVVFLSAKALTGSGMVPLAQDPATLAAWAIGGAWGLTLLAGACIFGFLCLTGVLLRRLLTWYTFPGAERSLLRIGWAVIVVLAFVLAVIVLPPSTALFQGDVTSLLQPIPLLSIGLVGLGAVAGGLWFIYQDHRYRRLCPVCNQKVPGWFALGRRCPECKRVLHPWLLANY